MNDGVHAGGQGVCFIQGAAGSGAVDELGSDACIGGYLQHIARVQMEEEWYLMILGTLHTLQMVCVWPLLTGWALLLLAAQISGCITV